VVRLSWARLVSMPWRPIERITSWKSGAPRRSETPAPNTERDSASMSAAIFSRMSAVRSTTASNSIRKASRPSTTWQPARCMRPAVCGNERGSS